MRVLRFASFAHLTMFYLLDKVGGCLTSCYPSMYSNDALSYCARHAPFGNDIGDLGMAFRCIRCDPNHAESRRWFSDELKATLPPDSQTVKRDGKVLGKPVDLWVLYHSVIVMGGFENVRMLH